MDAILDYAKSNGIEADEIVQVFEMCCSENDVSCCENGRQLRTLSDTSEKKPDHALISSQPSVEWDCLYVGLTKTLTEDELNNTKLPATGKTTERARTFSHPYSGSTPYLRVHGNTFPRNKLKI
eukprot:15365827-Ditylum_brightwellii.AAC.1